MSRGIIHRLLFLLLCAGAPALTPLLPDTRAQEAAHQAVVRGFVRVESSGRALQGANVVLRDTSGVVRGATATSGEGFYQISHVDPGRYALQISFVGYRSYRDTLRFSPGARRTVTVSLAAVPQQLAGVTVEGRQPVEEAQAGLQQVRTADVVSIPSPGPGSDLASYLRAQPSVTTTGDRGGRLYVRGGTPSQNLVLVDGLPIYKPFHIIGLYSAFPGDLISSADFYAGGFGGEYTGRISSVLDVNLRPGNMNRVEGRVGAGPFISSMQVEGPVVEGLSSFLVHARHSLIERSGPTLLGEDAPYKFYDLTAKGHFQSETSQCSLVGIRTYDRGRIDPDQLSSFRWTNTTLGGQCLVFAQSSAQVLNVSFGTSRFNNRVRSPDGSVRMADTWRVYTHFDLDQPAPWGNAFSWSVKVRADKYGLNLDQPFLGVEIEEEFLITTSTHFGTTFEWNSATTLSPSVAIQLPLSWGHITLEPRLRFSYRPGGSTKMKLTAAGGLYRQFTAGITDERDAGSTFRAFVPTPFENNPLRSVHALLGWDHQLLPPLRLSAEGWYKRLRDLPVPRWTPIVRFNTNLARANGTAYGADVSLQYSTKAARLALSYGYGKVTYRAGKDDLGAWTDQPVAQYSPPHDLRHKLGLTARLDADWLTTNIRWQYTSGLPFTSIYGFDTLLEIRGLRSRPTRDVGIPRTLFDRPYANRLPPSHRLDVSLERTVEIAPSLDLTVETGAINVYNRANVFYVDIFTLDRVDQLPVIPYLSLEVDVH